MYEVIFLRRSAGKEIQSTSERIGFAQEKQFLFYEHGDGGGSKWMQIVLYDRGFLKVGQEREAAAADLP